MTILIAIPVYRIACRVAIAKGRGWSVIEELVLWAMTRQAKSLLTLATDTGLPQQIVTAAVSRLMRFRLVEVSIGRDAAFKASDYGFKAISSGKPLPFFPTRINKKANFVIECVSGEFFQTRDVSVMSPIRLDQERENGAEIRTVSVEGGGPSISFEANLSRLSEISASGWNEEVASVDTRTALCRDDEFMIVRVVDGNPRGLPERAGEKLRKLVAEAAALPPGTGEIKVGYNGPRDRFDDRPIARACTFDFNDLIIGGSEQRNWFLALLKRVERRVIIHSTFLDAKKFEALVEPIRVACARGVVFDLLWGDDVNDDDTENKNAKAAIAIMGIVRNDPGLHGKVRIHMLTTGSHAKLVLADTDDGWVAAVGSCNWLSTPFNAVELSVVLRENSIVGDVMVALQRMVGRRGLSDSIAAEMAQTSRDLYRAPSAGGLDRLALIVGEQHDAVIRSASSDARHRFFVGSNRLGSTARPGALMQGEVAASRPGVEATVLYTQTAGPLKNRHARGLAEEAKANGLSLIKTNKIPLHGKVVAWDDDDVVVTSLNWASSSANPDFPWNDIGIHIHAPGVGGAALDRLITIFRELEPEVVDASGQALGG
jgi:cardiolipin synthase A/B